VTEIQRARIVAAAIDVVEETGWSRVTIAQIIGRARVSRKTFYEVFSDREDCFMAAFDQAVSQTRLAATRAFEGGVEWHEGIRAALASMLALMDDEPELARLCVVEAPVAGERVLRRRAELFDELASVVDRGRSSTAPSCDPPPLTAEGVVGAVFTVLHTRLLRGAREPLTDLLGPLMSMIVLPYLGSRAARRELTRPALARPAGPGALRPGGGRDVFDELNMRVTYRTVRVLAFISEHPGASNREVARGSGVEDQGQISKLLSRLERLGLARNCGEGAIMGAANSWELTARGAHLERVTHRYR
jgi:AcrR family transcriptional regulator